MADSATVNQKTGEVVADGHVRIEIGRPDLGRRTHPLQFQDAPDAERAIPHRQAAGVRRRAANCRATSATRPTPRATFLSRPTTSAIRPSASAPAASRLFPANTWRCGTRCCSWTACRRFIFRITGAAWARTRTISISCPATAAPTGRICWATYTWCLDDAVDGGLHLDYREKRGVGAGPDLNLHLGRWGEAEFKYYYLHDQDPNQSTNNLPDCSATFPKTGSAFYFGWQATPFTNLNVKALVNYQSDPLVLHDFSQGDYTGESAAEHVHRGQQILGQLEPRRRDDAAHQQFLRPGRAAARRETHRLPPADFRHAGLLRERKLRRLLPPDVCRHEQCAGAARLFRRARRHVSINCSCRGRFSTG